MNDELFEHYEEREEETRGLAENELEQQMEIDEEEENEDPSRVCWLNLCNDDRRCKILTGFSPEEFLTLYDLVEAGIVENIGRGRQSKISKFDRLLMTLCYLKHYETLDKMKDTFSISKTHLHTILDTTITVVTPILYAYYVREIRERTAEEDEEDYLPFPNAKYVMDATFQPIWTPTGTFGEKRGYFSGKHKMYGLKSQCIHDRKGRLVHCVPGEKGAVHDFKICRDHIDDVCYLHFQFSY